MRLNDLSGGSIKTLTILGLIVANLVVANFRHPGGAEWEGNDEARSPKLETTTRPEARKAAQLFVLGDSSFFRASDFELRH